MPLTAGSKHRCTAMFHVAQLRLTACSGLTVSTKVGRESIIAAASHRTKCLKLLSLPGETSIKCI